MGLAHKIFINSLNGSFFLTITSCKVWEETLYTYHNKKIEE